MLRMAAILKNCVFFGISNAITSINIDLVDPFWMIFETNDVFYIILKSNMLFKNVLEADDFE